ncbi:MAG: hypothetical protein Q7S40_04640 [Opitutaceae bacterium]|nr:hypothetical protein [Opitutaceae bacterium]
MNAFGRRFSIAVVIALASSGSYWLALKKGQNALALQKSQISEKSAEVQRLRHEVSRLEEKITAAAATAGPIDVGGNSPVYPSRSNPTVGSAVERMKLLAEMRNEKMATISLPILSQNGQLTRGIISLLELSDGETDALQKTITKALAAINNYAENNASLVHSDSDSVVISVAPFDGGADIYDSVTTSFEQTLGSERFNALMTLAANDLSKALHSYGAEKRTLTFTRQATQRGDYIVRDSREFGAGVPPFMTMAIFLDPGRLPDQYTWLAKFSSQLRTLKPALPKN